MDISSCNKIVLENVKPSYLDVTVISSYLDLLNRPFGSVSVRFHLVRIYLIRVSFSRSTVIEKFPENGHYYNSIKCEENPLKMVCFSKFNPLSNEFIIRSSHILQTKIITIWGYGGLL